MTADDRENRLKEIVQHNNEALAALLRRAALEAEWGNMRGTTARYVVSMLDGEQKWLTWPNNG
jgi:hypothetical protein